jgi:hypothetical protein
MTMYPRDGEKVEMVAFLQLFGLHTVPELVQVHTW